MQRTLYSAPDLRRLASYNTMDDKVNRDEFVARVIGTGTWLDWIKKMPYPVFALGKNDLYSVFFGRH
jgi:hypothetical protein